LGVEHGRPLRGLRVQQWVHGRGVGVYGNGRDRLRCRISAKKRCNDVSSAAHQAAGEHPLRACFKHPVAPRTAGV